MTRLTDERIAEIEARLTNTNPGQRSVHKRKDGSLCVSLGNPERGAHQQADFYFSEGEVDFFTQGKFDAEDLLAEVKTLKAEKAQAEAERDALAAELKKNWPFLSGVMYAAAEMVTNGMDATIPLDILMASGRWAEFEAHCNSCDVERFRQAVGEECVNRLRLGQRTQTTCREERSVGDARP